MIELRMYEPATGDEERTAVYCQLYCQRRELEGK
jgi:hypothetical protein